MEFSDTNVTVVEDKRMVRSILDEVRSFGDTGISDEEVQKVVICRPIGDACLVCKKLLGENNITSVEIKCKVMFISSMHRECQDKYVKYLQKTMRKTEFRDLEHQEK